MVAVRAYYDGQFFVPKSPVSAEIDQEAIITLLDQKKSDVSKKECLLRLAGSISHEDYLEMEKSLEETERIYPNEWQYS
jgi:hypothetical protein